MGTATAIPFENLEGKELVIVKFEFEEEQTSPPDIGEWMDQNSPGEGWVWDIQPSEPSYTGCPYGIWLMIFILTKMWPPE
jgi:hypothetical protein